MKTNYVIIFIFGEQDCKIMDYTSSKYIVKVRNPLVLNIRREFGPRQRVFEPGLKYLPHFTRWIFHFKGVLTTVVTGES